MEPKSNPENEYASLQTSVKHIVCASMHTFYDVMGLGMNGYINSELALGIVAPLREGRQVF